MDLQRGCISTNRAILKTECFTVGICRVSNEMLLAKSRYYNNPPYLCDMEISHIPTFSRQYYKALRFPNGSYRR